MVRTITRRKKRVLVIDFSYRKPDGSKGRYRHDAEVQTRAAAVAEGSEVTAVDSPCCGLHAASTTPSARAVESMRAKTNGSS